MLEVGSKETSDINTERMDKECEDLDSSENHKNIVEEIKDETESEPVSSDDESEPNKDDQGLLSWKFLQLPKARQDLLKNYKKDFEEAIVSPYETLGKILQSGSSMIKSNLEPAERALESGAEFLKSYQQPLHTVLESGTDFLHSLNIQEVVTSSSNVLITRVAAFTGKEE